MTPPHQPTCPPTGRTALPAHPHGAPTPIPQPRIVMAEYSQRHPHHRIPNPQSPIPNIPTLLRTLAEEAGAIFDRRDASICPLHPGADNPTAFRLYTGRDGRQRWHCFTRCPQDHNDGDAIDFYMRWRHVDFPTALQDLSHRAGLNPPTHPIPNTQYPIPNPQSPNPGLPNPRTSKSPLSTTHSPLPTPSWHSRATAFLRYAQAQLWSPAGAPVRHYLQQQRGLTPDTLRAWGLGYNPRDHWQAAAAWGLPGSRKVWCPRGILIPGLRDGALHTIKVRRPLPGDPLSDTIPPVKHLPKMKFSALRGGRATLFGAAHLAHLPLLLLTEGEFDALLAWQAAHDLCDVVSPGGASRRLTPSDRALLIRAWLILAVYDADPAGAAGAARLGAFFDRVLPLPPPAHDLTDYWRQGGDLRAWLAPLVAHHMERLLYQLDEQRHPDLFIHWLKIYETALATANLKACRRHA